MRPTHDVSAFVDWVVRAYEPSVRVSHRAGHYTRQPGVNELDLYGVADMACVLYTLGQLDPDEDERSDWADAFAGFQDGEGFFVEAIRTHDRLHSTAFVVAAMELVGLRPRRALTFAQAYTDPTTVEPFLDEIDWQSDVYMGSHRGAGLASLFSLDSSLGTAGWFDTYFASLDRRFDPANGMLGVAKPPSGDVDQIGGTFHYHFLYEWHHREMPHADARVDGVLALQLDDGFWFDDSPLWVTLDAIYLLTRTCGRTGYRVDDVRAAVHLALDALESRVLDPEHRDEHFAWYLGAHSLTAAVSALAEAQRFLGAPAVYAGRPLRLVLDRRPFV